MPFDSWGSYLENDIGELEQYLEAVNYILSYCGPTVHDETLKKLSRDLQRQKEHKEYELRTHRQRDKERGIKY